MRHTDYASGWATLAFLLAFLGFGSKAGIIPLHVWLPEAHPVAPTNVSALMSGVMLKTAIYGMIRVTFDLIKVIPWWWGVVVLVFGLVSAVMGVLYALMQHDLKRLLAYHSVENIGIILIGIGLAMTFTSFEIPVLAALALTAGLYHTFNGFVSEWLTFQAFLLSPALHSHLLNLLIPLGAALLALSAALAAACFVKAFGVTFLGHWRGHSHSNIYEVNWPMRVGMMLAALTCLGLGVLYYQPLSSSGWIYCQTRW